MNFIKTHKADILKLLLVLLPMIGLGGLNYEQQKEIEKLRTTIVITQDPVQVHIEQKEHTHPVHSHKHSHPELERWH